MSYEVSVVFKEDSSLNAIQITVSAPERSRQVEELMARLVQKEHSYIDVPSDGGRTVRLRTDSIIRIYSQNRKNYISTADGIIRTSAPINELFTQLGGGFLRISRFEIINLDKAVYLDFSIVGELKIKLEGDQMVFASRRYIPVIRDYLKGGDET